MGWNSSVHRYDLQFKGPKKETVGPEELCQRARIQSSCPVPSTAPSCSTSPGVMDVPAHSNPKTSWALYFVPSLLLCQSLWAVTQDCARAANSSAHLSPAHLNRFLSTAPHKTPAEGSCCLKCLPLQFQALNHFPRKKTQRDSPQPFSQVEARRCLMAQSLAASVCHTSGWGHRGIPEMAQYVQDSWVCHPSAHKTRELGNVTIFVQMVLSGFQPLLPESESIFSVNGCWRFLKSRFHQTTSGDHLLNWNIH